MSAPNPWILVAHYADGERVTTHATKREAKRLGLELCAAGVDAFVYDLKTARLVGVLSKEAA